MFDTGEVEQPVLQVVPTAKELAGHVDGVTTGDRLIDHRFPVHEALQALVPAGIQPGSTIGVIGDASVSLAFVLVARAVTEDRWLGIVGARRLGLGALAATGVPLERVVVFEAERPSDHQVVVATVIDGFDLVIVGDDRGQVIADHRLTGRARERGVVLISVDTSVGTTLGRHRWTNRPDLIMDATTVSWDGIGAGHGHLQSRLVEVSVAGRRQARPLVQRLWLPDRHGTVGSATVVEADTVDPTLAQRAIS